ncbi:MAG: RidA family protein [Hyphomicrobiaceae bacterium TMED74]|jgi:2-iminobutanoate/2-iminopropanoate deaminase|nr:reactive intermediate/imine deaminase [Filomicrobium sp.]RPG41703.1 MAG: RidA family protein [Hyphomicrobiaceae bacterium TMED74]
MTKRAIIAAPLEALGPYSLAIEDDGTLYISGQIHIDPSKGGLVEGSIGDQSRQCLENLKSVLTSAGYDFGNIVKTTVFLVDMADFPAMNEVYATYMVEPFPARSTIQVAGLPLGARVEIEAIAKR